MSLAEQQQLFDGSDHSFRMTIEDRYKRMVQMRKIIRYTSLGQLVYLVIRGLWKALPAILYGSQFPLLDQVITAAGILLYPFYLFSFGFGKTHKEKQWAIQTYSIAAMLLFCECFLTFWIYHVMLGPQSHDETAAAMYPPIPRGVVLYLQKNFALSASVAAVVLKVLDVFEKAFDVIGLFATGIGIWYLKELVVAKREAKREAETKKAAVAGKKDE